MCRVARGHGGQWPRATFVDDYRDRPLSRFVNLIDDFHIMISVAPYPGLANVLRRNWLDPDRLPVRLLLVGVMFASLLMSVAIGDASASGCSS